MECFFNANGKYAPCKLQLGMTGNFNIGYCMPASTAGKASELNCFPIMYVLIGA